MQTDVKKVFYFHADANALGGFAEEPHRIIPAQASVSLASVGGRATHRLHDFKFDDVLSCHSTYTHVAGHPVKRNGPWVARVTSVIEGLDILGVIKADLAVAQIYVEHPADDAAPRVSFAGSYFRDLRINGKLITISINPKLLPNGHPSDHYYYDQDAILEPEIEWSVLTEVAKEQSDSLTHLPGAPTWIAERFKWPEAATGQESYAICSLVDKLDGGTSGQNFGHVADIPDVGRFFFGEAMVLPQSIQLTMVRAELGCGTTAQASAATARTNGKPWPP